MTTVRLSAQDVPAGTFLLTTELGRQVRCSANLGSTLVIRRKHHVDANAWLELARLTHEMDGYPKCLCSISKWSVTT